MSEMERNRRDETFEQLVAGSGADDDGALAAFVDQVRKAHVRPPSPQRSQQHMAAIVEAAGAAPTRQPAPRRRQPMLTTLFASLVGKIAVATLGLGVATAAMASTDMLPGPAQDAVARAAETVGVDFPDSSEDVAASADDESDDDAEADRPEESEEGQAKAEANREAARSFTDAQRAWSACVSEAAPQHRGPGAFDPEEACGEKPHPSDHGVGQGTEQADDESDRPENAGPPEGVTPSQADQGLDRADQARNNRPSGGNDQPEEADEGMNQAESNTDDRVPDFVTDRGIPAGPLSR